MELHNIKNKIRYINYFFSRLPIIRHFFRWLRGKMLGEKKWDWEVHDWAMDGLDIAKNIHPGVEFRFSRDGVFVKGIDGIEYEFDIYPATAMPIAMLKGIAPVSANEISVIKKNIKSGAVVIDAGAGVGEYAMNIALNVPNSLVHSFEPMTSSFNVLRKNIAKNVLADRVCCYKMALADRVGEFGITPINIDENHLVLEEKSLLPIEEVVAVTTVDNWMEKENINAVDFIKADVQGAELLLLKGAEKCLKNKPYLLLEIVASTIDKMGYKPADIFEYLKKHGYNHILFSDNGLPIVKPDNYSIEEQLRFGYNFFFYHKTKKLSG